MSALLVAERDVPCVHVCTRVRWRENTGDADARGVCCVWSALPAVVQKMRGQHRDEDVLPVHGKEQSGGAVDTRR